MKIIVSNISNYDTLQKNLQEHAYYYYYYYYEQNMWTGLRIDLLSDLLAKLNNKISYIQLTI